MLRVPVPKNLSRGVQLTKFDWLNQKIGCPNQNFWGNNCFTNILVGSTKSFFSEAQNDFFRINIRLNIPVYLIEANTFPSRNQFAEILLFYKLNIILIVALQSKSLGVYTGPLKAVTSYPETAKKIFKSWQCLLLHW